MMNVLARLFLKVPGVAYLVVLLGTILAVAGTYYSIQLYQNLRTDLEELLPTTARSVIDLDEVTHRLESIENLAVLVFSDHPQASKKFVRDLAEKLKAGPKDTIASVEYRIDQELKFFNARKALYMELSDLEKIRDYIRDRIDFEKALYNPLNIFSGVDIPEPRLDFMGMQKKYGQKTSSYSRFPEGYYATPDGKKRVILAYMPGKSSGVAGLNRLKNFVVKSAQELKPETYAPDIVIKYTGGVQDTIEEQEALVEDLTESTVIVVVIVSLAMFAFYRSFLPTIALLISLFMGTLWTFGIAFFAVGYLNANSAFLGSIVIGNGINFGVIFLARYLEERRNQGSHEQGIRMAMTKTSTATLTAALAAGLSYGSLIFTGFRGFKQFGIIGLIGMVLCWLSAYILLPNLLTVFEKLHPVRINPNRKSYSVVAAGAARLVAALPKPIWIASLVLTAIALTTFGRLSPSILESDLTKLRNKHSMEHGSGYLSKHVDEIFQRYLSPMVALPHTREHALAIAAKLKDLKAQQGDKSLIASVQTIDDFLPKDQPKKIELLHEIDALLTPRIRKQLSPEDKARVTEFFTPEAFHPISLHDLPPLVLSKFTEKDGSIGKLVVVEPPISHETLNGQNLVAFISELRNAADSVAPGTPVAGSLAISGDMLIAITRDGPRATLFALISVVVLVIVLFRNPKTISLILFALFMGVVWLAGAILGFDLKINFLNFIALPITFGIGVDYGVNIFERYREEGSASIVRVIRDTGGAVLLSSFTTIVGYSSLLIASNQAFVSFGRLAVLGEVTCVLAAIFALPAFLLFRQRGIAQGSEST